MSDATKCVFNVGELYTHEEVFARLGVGNAGGIRPKVGRNGKIRRLVLMTAEPSAKSARENPYHDRIEGNVLVYTAAGREGHQQLIGANTRLLAHPEHQFPIYGFSNIGSRRNIQLGQRRWRFLGLLQYLRHFIETQSDSRGEPRNTVVFELFIHTSHPQISPIHDEAVAQKLYLEISKDEFADREVVSRERVPEEEFEAPLVEATRRRLLSLAPARFEQVVKNALEATGFERVTVTRYAADGGVDVNAFASNRIWPFAGNKIQVQAKRWLHTVGRREVAELRGSLEPQAHGAIVTTSFYSKGALVEAREGLKKPIILVNGIQFASVVLRTRCEIG